MIAHKGNLSKSAQQIAAPYRSTGTLTTPKGRGLLHCQSIRYPMDHNRRPGIALWGVDVSTLPVPRQ
ncbi:hypothetical protein [Luteimonas salinilitoris]|uniref:Uncharacterized protein n=1 Tax=Luteimonas salinilitoris TaxID=3237697 RepID=A0ABV4HTR8_9GAMM